MKRKSAFDLIRPYQPGKPISEVKRELGLDEIYKLASNENPYGFSEAVKTTITNSLDTLNIYPDGAAFDLKSELAGFHNITQSQLMIGNGSDEIIQILCRTFLEPNTNAVAATHTFSQYKHNAIIEGAETKEIPLVNGYHDYEKMIEAIDESTRILWICNPNNPTGTYLEGNAIEDIMKKVPNHVLVVLDEAYFEYVQIEKRYDSKNLVQQYENVIVLRTFSKAYGLAALRVGYGIANEKLIEMMEPAREPFNTSTLAQAAAVTALQDTDFIQNCYESNKKVMNSFAEFCTEQGYKVYDSETNFLLVDFHKDGEEVFQYLLSKGFITRSGKALGLPTCVRITVGSEDVMNKLQQVLVTMKKEASSTK